MKTNITAGRFNLNIVDMPTWFNMAASLVILDLAIYFQHRLFHAVPWLWRVHRMHHADLEFDTTTGLRFHPIEIVISMGFKLGIVIALGVPALAVLIFDVLLDATSLFNYSNVRLPGILERRLHRMLIQPFLSAGQQYKRRHTRSGRS